MKNRVGIVGYGYVGKGMHRMFGEWVEAVYSPHATKDECAEISPVKSINDKKFFKDLDLAIICVPTSMKESGQCDTTIVEESVECLAEVGAKLVIIKSTIEPGTTKRLQEKYPNMGIVFSPEYLGEGKYFVPFWMYPDPENPISHGFMVIGGEDEASEDIANIFVKKMGPHTKFVFMPSHEAEIVKYWENIWGAMKVIFTNHMSDCIKSLGGNFYRAREGWAADPRVERMHTAVFKDARGFSGKCYPKDLSGFIYAVEQSGFDPKLLKMIWNLNCEYRKGEFKEKE